MKRGTCWILKPQPLKKLFWHVSSLMSRTTEALHQSVHSGAYCGSPVKQTAKSCFHLSVTNIQS